MGESPHDIEEILGEVFEDNRRLKAVRTRPRYWALQANPNIYRIEDAVVDLDVDPWSTAGKDLQRGDKLVIWKAKGRGLHRRIVALGVVLSQPYVSTNRSNS